MYIFEIYSKVPKMQLMQANMSKKDFERLTFFRLVKILIYKNEKHVAHKTDCKYQDNQFTIAPRGVAER